MGGKAIALCAMLASCGRFDFAELAPADAASDAGAGSGICTTHWCWDNPPTPDHATLHAIAGTSATNIWAVGDGGVIRVWDGSAWTLHPFPTRDAIVAIVMQAPDDVGVAVRGGIVWHWDGATWTANPSPAGSSIAAFWLTPNGSIVGAADVGKVSVDITAAPPRPSGTAATAVHGRNQNDVSVTGLFNTYSHWDGATWTEVLFGEFPRAVWNTSTTTWVGGDAGIWSCTPAACTQDTVIAPGIRGMWGASDSDVWAVGAEIAHYNGAAWSIKPLAAGAPLNAVWGAVANDVLAVGQDGRIVHYDGTSWSEVASAVPGGPTWNAAWAASATDLWLGATAIERYDTQSLTQVASTAIGDEMWGTSASDVYATDPVQNSILHWTGAAAADEPGLMIPQPDGLTITPAGEVLAGSFAGNGFIWSKIAGSWTLTFTSVEGSLFTGACSAANNDVIFVARFGNAVTRIAGTWGDHDTPSGRFLLACAWIGAQAWAVGGDAVELYAGGAWTDLTTHPTRQTLSDIKAVGQSLIVVGSSGVVFSGDGTTWAEESTPTGHDLHKLAVAPDGTVYAVGVDGVVLHRQ